MQKHAQHAQLRNRAHLRAFTRNATRNTRNTPDSTHATRVARVHLIYVCRKDGVMEEKGLRALMPATAEIVDELRAACGRELVDAAIAAGQRARREHARISQALGQVQADAWLAAQRWPQGRFWASEGGREVGVRLGQLEGRA